VSVRIVEPWPVFDHLERLTDAQGLFEHALYDVPRPEHGYCVDDVARALVVVCRQPVPDTELQRLCQLYLDFTLSAVRDDGMCHNRMDADGQWTDEPALGDWWGRALWGLGVAAVHAPTAAMRSDALRGFHTAAARRSPHLRATVFAALGAGEVALAHPDDHAARELLREVVRRVGPPRADVAWPWPEPRLSYGNGAVVEALLLAGVALGDPVVAAHALVLLDFLLRTETFDGHLSVTPVGGRGPTDSPFVFDQQPIEVAALADACARAFTVTGDREWLDAVRSAWAWFLGDNDSATRMFDPATGGGFDGLEPDGANLNQGAESTLALLSTAQQAQRLAGQS
jgi:hypothetical protein